MKSMTGYANYEKLVDGFKVAVEIRSENHRFLDCKMNIPDSLGSFEHELMNLVKDRIYRGKLNVMILVEGKKGTLTKFDKETGRQFAKALRTFVSDLGMKDDITLDHLLVFKDLFNDRAGNNLSRRSVDKIKEILTAALKKLEANRDSEGKKLKRDLTKRIKACSFLVKKVKRKRDGFSKQAFKRLKTKVQTLLKDVKVDDHRLYQEIVIQTEKSDITEELVRLEAHIEKFTETLNGNGPMGKELDFLVQEMNREAGTISAKCKDAAVTHQVIILRSELEKIREQIQNAE